MPIVVALGCLLSCITVAITKKFKNNLSLKAKVKGESFMKVMLLGTLVASTGVCGGVTITMM